MQYRLFIRRYESHSMSATCGARCDKFARRVLRGGTGTSGFNRKTCPYPPLPCLRGAQRVVIQDDRELRICLPFTTGKYSIRNAVKAPPIIRAGIHMPQGMASSAGW
jgi:hypothetical protein